MSLAFIFGFLIFMLPFIPMILGTASFSYVQTGWVLVFLTAPVGIVLMILGFLFSSGNGRTTIFCLLLLCVFVYCLSGLSLEDGISKALLPTLLSGLALALSVVHLRRTYRIRANEEEDAYWRKRHRKNWTPLEPEAKQTTEEGKDVR